MLLPGGFLVFACGFRAAAAAVAQAPPPPSPPPPVREVPGGTMVVSPQTETIQESRGVSVVQAPQPLGFASDLNCFGYVGPPREAFSATVIGAENLAEHEFSVGYFYMRKGAPSAALARFIDLEQRYPEYGARDKLLFYSARVLEKLGRREEADRYYGRVITEFPESEFARKAKSARGEKPAAPSTATASPQPTSPN